MRKILIGLLVIFVFIFNLTAALAQSTVQDNTGGQQTTHDNTDSDSSSLSLTNPLGISSPQALIGRVINSIMGLVGSIALVMFVYGGLTWMTSSGNDEKVKKGREIIIWSAIGLVVVFMSYALTRFVITTIVQ
ncbi:MAG: pilin [Patescibacteria group bacterium]